MAGMALICRDYCGAALNPATGFWELGDWHLPGRQAETTTVVTLHEAQDAPSYAAFSVIATRPRPNGRFAFIARPIDYTAHGTRLCWAQEKALF